MYTYKLVGESRMGKKQYRIVIAGAGFSGAILARQLKKHTDAEVVIVDKCKDISDSETGTGLNLNSNALAALKSLDPELETSLRSRGLPRRVMKAETMHGEVIYNELISDDHGRGLALNSGLRIRWSDAYAAVRNKLDVLYHTQVLGYSSGRSKKGLSVHLKKLGEGQDLFIDDVDLLIGADGRYSIVRDKISPATPTFINVSP